MNNELPTQASGTLIIIGASAKDLDSYRSYIDAGLDRLIVIEPDAALAAQIAAGLSDLTQAVVLAAMPVSQDPQASPSRRLRAYNAPGLRSFFEPTEDMQLVFPGLQVRKETTVVERKMTDLWADVGPLSSPTSLRLKLAGSELEILKAWGDAGRLSDLSQIEITCSRAAVFNHLSHRATVQAWVQDQGFRVSDVDNRDLDWPVLQFERHPSAAALLAAQRDITTLKTHHTEALSKMEAAHKDLMTEIRAARRKLSKWDSMIQERKIMRADIKKQATKIDDLKSRLAEDRSALDTARADRDIAQSDATEAQAKLDVAKSELGEKTSRIMELGLRAEQARRDLRRAEGQMEIVKDLLLRRDAL